MRLAICDRNSSDRATLARLLVSAFTARSVAVAVEQYAESDDLLGDVEDGEHFDGIILDLEVGDGRGLDTAKALRSGGFEGEIVFSSGSADFAVDGYEVGASGYLLKPYRAARLLRLVQAWSERTRPQCLTVCHYRTIVRVPYHDILFIESRNTKCVIHRRGGEEYHVYRQLDDLQNELHDARFLRCHQSYLVNMDQIVAVDTQFEVDGGKTVAIRQRELRRIRDQYLEYIAHSEL
ncbi:MAG: response regulator transcription factor [Clostridia bacterium]|nr:response regulator transcription factor [Clostridia bacterium]